MYIHIQPGKPTNSIRQMTLLRRLAALPATTKERAKVRNILRPVLQGGDPDPVINWGDLGPWNG